MKIPLPKAPHLLTSKCSKKDEAYDKFQTKDYLVNRLVFQEKIDGFPISIEFSNKGELIVKHNNKVLSQNAENKAIMKYAISHEALLLNYLSAGLILIGEWMKNRNEVFYNALPGYLVITDVYDVETEMFYSTPKIINLASVLDLPYAPTLREGVYGLEDIQAWTLRPSAFGLEQLEGIYIRYEDEHRTISRAQLIGARSVSKAKNKHNIIRSGHEKD